MLVSRALKLPMIKTAINPHEGVFDCGRAVLVIPERRKTSQHAVCPSQKPFLSNRCRSHASVRAFLPDNLDASLNALAASPRTGVNHAIKVKFAEIE